MLDRFARWVVVHCFPRTAEALWFHGFTKGVECSENMQAWSYKGRVYPERSSGTDSLPSLWSGHA